MRTFLEARELHAELDELFLDHQRALLDRDWAAALDRLSRYERVLAAHMRDEEEALLPIYEARAAAPRGGAPRLFYEEHRKLCSFLAHFREQIPRVAAATDPARALLKLLDRESTFKHLVEHHDEREEKFLYPALEEVTTAEERARLLDRLAAHRDPASLQANKPKN